MNHTLRNTKSDDDRVLKKYVKQLPRYKYEHKYREYSVENTLYRSVCEHMCKLTCIISSLGKGSFGKKVKFHHKVKIFGDCSYHLFQSEV